MALDIVDEIAVVLQSATVRPNELVVPGPAGMYAWWVGTDYLADARPPFPEVRLPSAGSQWSLLYVGIGPKRPGKRTLSDRLRKDHRSGSIGSSTFRQSLAALLVDKLELRAKSGHDRSRLVDEMPLSEWIYGHCGVSAVAVARPWDYEDEVIRHLNPPLNLKPGFHPYRHDVDRAREELRRACGLIT
jgi:hypothetical protein